MKVLLASCSPRRRELLHKIFDNFDVSSPNIDEDYIGTDYIDTVTTIANRKLLASVSINYDIIIAADTMVVLDDKVIGKPTSIENAVEILSTLNGRTHLVITAVAISYYKEVISFFDISEVTFKNLTLEELELYTKNNYVLDKAGAYAIQDSVVVKAYKGSYDNIVGLPTEKLKHILYEKNTNSR